MANAAGFIQESIWRDPHWRQLSRSAQALYMQLLSQKELDCAGILPLQPNKWAKGCAEMTLDRVWADLGELQRELFVFFDAETDETFVRTYIRNSNVIKVPNMMKSALRAAVLVGSEVIKPLLADELRATGRDDAIKVADQINPSETPPEPFGNGSKSNPSETLSEPTGVGTGVGVGVTLVSTQVGEGARPQCHEHQENSAGRCRACMRRREWDEAHEADELESRRAAKVAAASIAANCPTCHGTNWIPDTEPAIKCAHQLPGKANA
jgi:hypothetical protein